MNESITSTNQPHSYSACATWLITVVHETLMWEARFGSVVEPWFEGDRRMADPGDKSTVYHLND
jgi:hypothetical protein